MNINYSFDHSHTSSKYKPGHLIISYTKFELFKNQNSLNTGKLYTVYIGLQLEPKKKIHLILYFTKSRFHCSCRH
jgi:hypothetical protein